MTKFIAKTETLMTKSVALTTRIILQNTFRDYLNTQATLERIIAKLLGECIISKQEVWDLILS